MESYVVEAFGRPLTRLLRETPRPTGTQVLLRVRASGVCHSDVHLHDGFFDLGEGRKLDLSRSVPLPRVLGHEIAGTVVEAGPNAQGVSPGDARVAYPWIGCANCRLCSAGLEHLCGAPQVLGLQHDGGFADHVLVPHPRYLLAYDPLPAAQACTYACAGVTAYSALQKVQHGHGDEPLLILGAGGVGLSAIRLARVLMPATPILVAEVDHAKWDTARAAGATEAFDPTADGAAKTLMKNTGGGVSRAIDFVGAASTHTFGFGALRKAGTLVTVGLFGGVAPLHPVMVAMKAVSIVGSYVGSLAELAELLALARTHELPPLPIVTRTLAEAGASLDDLRQGRVRGRVVLEV